jgi:hypothetical protein
MAGSRPRCASLAATRSAVRCKNDSSASDALQRPAYCPRPATIAVTKLVNQTLGAVAAPETLSQADVEREYQARQASDFTLPPAAQVRHIHLSDPKLAERPSSPECRTGW